MRKYFDQFMTELTKQVEMGQLASDSDYVAFQRSVNANVKSGARTRQEIMLRKLFRIAPELSQVFDASVIAESGVSGRIAALGDSIANLVEQINEGYAARNGEDYFKATNKTAQALNRLRKPVKDLHGYESLIDDLYFLFRESVGSRNGGVWLTSFTHVNTLRTDLRHDVDHGEARKVRNKRRNIGETFRVYAGDGTPSTLEPEKFSLVHANLLGAIEGDLRNLRLKGF
jgi:hypothetical protein